MALFNNIVGVASLSYTHIFCSFMGRGVIDKPVKEIATFLRNVENNLSWDKFLIVRN